MPCTRRTCARAVPTAGHQYVRRSRPSRLRTKRAASLGRSLVTSRSVDLMDPAGVLTSLPLVVGALECGDVDLAHLEHRLHNASGLLGILVPEHLAECGRDDLPREPVLVFQPAAAILRPASGELLPQLVDLGLGLAAHKERDRLGE